MRLHRRRRLPHRDDDGRRGNEVDLEVPHPILVRKRARRDENAEDIRTVALEQGARLATVLGGRYERLDDVGVDLDRQGGEEPRGTGRRGRASARSQSASVVSGAVGDRYAVTAVTSGW